MSKHPDKNNEKSITLTSLKSGAKSLSKEVIINYLADGVDKVIQFIAKNYLPIIASTIISLSAAIYAVFIRYTRETYIFTGTQILASVLLVVLFLTLVFISPKIRKIYIAQRGMYKKIFELNWRLDGNRLIGPYCPHCNKSVISEDSLVEDMEQIIDRMFGEQKSFKYSCSRCNNQITLDASLERMKVEVYRRILEMP